MWRNEQLRLCADNLIDVDSQKSDWRLWNFLLPEKFTGWFGSWYAGTSEFTLSSFCGDCSGVNNHWVNETFVHQIWWKYIVKRIVQGGNDKVYSLM